MEMTRKYRIVVPLLRIIYKNFNRSTFYSSSNSYVHINDTDIQILHVCGRLEKKIYIKIKNIFLIVNSQF